MRYLALATDYDGTLATGGKIDDATFAALERLRESGRKLIMVTGRELPDLERVCPRLDLFDRIVAENGALLYEPATKKETPLAPKPPDEFAALLAARGVAPMSVGRVIVATWEPHENIVLETIRDLGLELQVIFNKGAVMILPSGVNKATGLQLALDEMGLSMHNVVAVGDAENDHALCQSCEASAAVANALPTLKETTDIALVNHHGAGVTELIDRMLEDDLTSLEPRLTRHHLLLGNEIGGAQQKPSPARSSLPSPKGTGLELQTAEARVPESRGDASDPAEQQVETEIRISPFCCNVLVTGSSGGGKSTLTLGFLERLTKSRYQYCVIDPEGDFQELAGAVSVGNAQQQPDLDSVVRLLEKPSQNGVVNMLGVPFADRPAFFLKLLGRLQEMRSRTGHPHWIIVDEAHHVLPSSWEPSALVLPNQLDRMWYVTLEPNLVAKAVLEAIDTVITVGKSPDRTLKIFCDAVEAPLPKVDAADLPKGEVLFWPRKAAGPPRRMKIVPAENEQRRHSRKYAEGELEPDRSFYFRGPERKLKLRAQNLVVFVQMAEGVDDETWQFHLAQGHYSDWFRQCIKDDQLAKAAQAIERDADKLSVEASRGMIKQLVEKHYTLPGGKSGESATEAVG